MEEDVSTGKDHSTKKEKESAGLPSEESGLSTTTRVTGMSAPSVYRTANGVTIDFHSPEFNHTDDLTDCSGNYRFFEPLDGVVTSHMRHQMERLRDEGCSDITQYEDPPARKKEEEKKGDTSETSCDLSPLTVTSEGRTLIIDTDVTRGRQCAEFLNKKQLNCTLVVLKQSAQDGLLSRLSRLTLIEADDVAITGAFGGFSAVVTVQGEQRPLMEGFDLVLDLRPLATFAGTRAPVGYYAPGQNPEELNPALEELPEMRGRFKKPRFMAFLASRCFHGRARTLDCQRCIEICPFGAIQPEKGNISFNHYLCQGCGGCALACPADAIHPIHPSPEEFLKAFEEKLINHKAGAGMPVTLIISDCEDVYGDKLQQESRSKGSIFYFHAEEIGRIGLETILTAFSHGVDEVVIACKTENPQGIRDAVARQALMARAILKGIGVKEDKCRFVVSPVLPQLEEEISSMDCMDGETYAAPLSGVEPSFGQERRRLTLLAAQHLCEISGRHKTWIPLPAGSPFGTVTMDGDGCTLCMACVASCPSGALSAVGDVPRLTFLESQCHQCGLCVETCPERVIQLLPRMPCNVRTVETPIVLSEAKKFRCVKCNAPFASQAMVERMTDKLKGHWMYANERQLQRLQMCRVCRTRDALVSEDMRLWNR